MTCPICSSTEATSCKNGSYSLNQCTQCTGIWTPTVATTEYYTQQYNLVQQLSDFEHQRRYIERLPEQWKLLSTIEQFSNGKNLLDIGCDFGHFLDIARRNGYYVTGVEPSETARAYSSQIGIETYKEISGLPSKKYDVITLWHCLEHIEFPVQFLGQIASKHCSNETVVCIRVPNYKSLPSKLFKSKWIWFQPKQHHLHFTKKSLQNALELAGFEVKFLQSQRPNSLKTIFGSFFALAVESNYSKRGIMPTFKAIARSIWHYLNSVELFAIASVKSKN